MTQKHGPPYGQILLGFIIGAAALAWTLYDIPLSELWQELTQAHLLWLLLVGGMFMLQQVIRAARQMLIIQAQYPDHTFRQSFAILCIGFFFINTLPARIGELVRPFLLKRDGIPYGNGLALIFTERTIDLCAALVMFTATLGQLNLDALKHPVVQSSQQLVFLMLPALILLLLSFIFIAPRYRSTIVRLSQSKLLKPIGPFTLEFIDAMGRLSPKRLALVLILTTITWSLTGWMTIAGLAAFDLHHGRAFLDGIGILAFTMLGMAAPSAPGFAGAYEAAVILGCLSLGMTQTVRITAFAIGFHWWIQLVQSLSALVYAGHPHYGFGIVINQIRMRAFGSRRRTPEAPDA